MIFSGWRLRASRRRAARLVRRRAGLRTWRRSLGSDGLSPRARALVLELEAELRQLAPTLDV